jgi:hypothetical protein
MKSWTGRSLTTEGRKSRQFEQSENYRNQPGERNKAQKALTHNNIGAFLSVATETVLKQFCDLGYLCDMSQVSRDI